MNKSLYVVGFEETERDKAIRGEDFVVTFNGFGFEQGDVIACDPQAISSRFLVKSTKVSDAPTQGCCKAELSWDKSVSNRPLLLDRLVDIYFAFGTLYFKWPYQDKPEKKQFIAEKILFANKEFAVIAFPGKKYDKGWVIRPTVQGDIVPYFVVNHVSEYFPGTAVYFLKRYDGSPQFRSIGGLLMLEGVGFHGTSTVHSEYDSTFPSDPDISGWY